MFACFANEGLCTQLPTMNLLRGKTSVASVMPSLRRGGGAYLEIELKTSDSMLSPFGPPTRLLREPIAPRFAGVAGKSSSGSAAAPTTSCVWLKARCGSAGIPGTSWLRVTTLHTARASQHPQTTPGPALQRLELPTCDDATIVLAPWIAPAACEALSVCVRGSYYGWRWASAGTM
jgi:hypothetical protein